MREPVCLSLTASHAVLHTVPEQRAFVQDKDWQGALTEVFDRHRTQRAPAKLEVQAHLGQDHARVAIMTVDQPDGFLAIPTAKHEPLVHAWAADMLHVQSVEQVVRWRALADPRLVLVSCVSRATAEALERACEQAGVHLASCRPAVFLAMRTGQQVRADSQSRDLTVIWTEDAAEDQNRHPTVQLLRFRDGRLNAMWRGWLPARDDVAANESVEAVVSRFEAAGGAAKVAREKIHWPTAALA